MFLSLLCLLAVSLTWSAPPALAGGAPWVFDGDRYHVSAHGQLSCLECHQDMEGQSPHPDPNRVNKPPRREFKPAACYECHQEIQDDLKQGVHAGQTGVDAKQYQSCLSCHDPHYMLSKEAAKTLHPKPGARPDLQCAACHEEQKALPPPEESDQACYVCHVARGRQGPGFSAQIDQICLSCHSQTGPAAGKASLVDRKQFGQNAHAGLNCLTCHPKAAQYGHSGQPQVDCLACHLPHPESVSHAAHLDVSCQACHLKGGRAIRKQPGGPVVFQQDPAPQAAAMLHGLVDFKNQAACKRCHFKGNQAGAPDMVLPAKGVTCMPCHSATLSISDNTTLASLAIFLVGLIGAFSYWMSGSPEAKGAGFFRTLFSRRITKVLGAIFWDGLLQRGLWRISKLRGLIHFMIFAPFVFRFTWGILALALTEWSPQSSWGWAMIDNNHPLTAFAFDLSGLLVLLGAALGVGRHLMQRGKPRPANLPKPDWVALSLILGVVLAGFALEAVRMAMTGGQATSAYAFLGRPLSLLLGSGPWLNQAYGYLWYVHAILTGAFVAYLPFSRMFHIFTAPVVLAMKAGGEETAHQRQD